MTFPLPVVSIEAITSHRDLFVCTRLQRTPSILSAGACVLRQRRQPPQPGRRQGTSFSPCHNRCSDGARVKALVGAVPVPVAKPHFEIHLARHVAEKRVLDVPCPYCTSRLMRPGKASCGQSECRSKATAANPPKVKLRRPPPVPVAPCVCACGAKSMTPECWKCRARAKKKVARKSAAEKRTPGIKGPLTPVTDEQLRADFAESKSINAVARKCGATFKSVALRLRKVGALQRSDERPPPSRLVGRYAGLNHEVVAAALLRFGKIKIAARELGVDPKTIRYWSRKKAA